MKRLAVLGTVATFAIASIAAVPRTAHAQLTMQMGNGWSLSFSGNVNAFEVEGFSSGAPADVTYGAVNSAEGTTNRVRTGLLPAFAVFDVKGKEGPLDLGVHFGFAPQIQTGSSCSSSGGTQHDNFGCGTQAGAQIDMRQVYLTLGGSWGQILAGREIGLYQREEHPDRHDTDGCRCHRRPDWRGRYGARPYWIWLHLRRFQLSDHV